MDVFVLQKIMGHSHLRDGYYLPACIQMALTVLDTPVTQQRLAQLFGTVEAGTPFSRVEQLATLGVTVKYGKDGMLDVLNAALAADAVAIAAVYATWLPNPNIESQYVVLWSPSRPMQ